MLLFSLKFWRQYNLNPKEALESLRANHSGIAYPVLKFIAFIRIIFSEYFQNHCITRAAALAFALLLTLIPLLVSVSVVLTKVMEVKLPQMEKAVAFFLPFAPPDILAQLSVFFANAQKVRGMGITVLVIVAVCLFGTVEQSLNTIWKVSRSRSFFVRLRTFTMVMVYSPIFFFASFQIRRNMLYDIDLKKTYIYSLDVLSFFLIALAVTLFFWVVPNTKVKFRYAILGGLVAGILFELERRWFSTYVMLSSQTQTIYGAFGILSFFLISLFLASCFILFGAEVAYVAQNFKPLLRAKKRWERRVGEYKTYFSLRIMIDIVDSFLRNKQPPTISQLMKKYEMTLSQVQGILDSLVRAGYVHVINGREAYVPTRDFSQTSVREVLDTLEDENRSIPSTPDDYTKNYVAAVIDGVKRRASSPTDDLTFDKLVADLEQGERRKKTRP
jgi:membrane protein